MEVECVPCSPYGIVCEVLSTLRVRAREKCLQLDVQWRGAIPAVIQTDPVRVRQVLMNVVGNAIKFTEQGGVTLTVGIVQATNESFLSIEVQDTGIGIRRERLEQIFAPFAQADNSITRRFGGSGLGMTISREIARLLGGDLTVDSEPGCGSTFQILINAGTLEGVQCLDVPQAEALRAGNPIQHDGRIELDGCRILVVDDGETNRDLIELLLTDAGAEVVCKENGRDGLEAALGGRFDLILMDIQMPVMDGISATGAIRARAQTTPVIALTAHAMRGDKESCLAAGFNDYLSKPLDIDELMNTVARVLKASPHQPLLTEKRSALQSPHQEVVATDRIHSTLPMERPEIRRIVSRFMAKLSERLDQCATSIEREELSEVGDFAHWLKGAGGTMGLHCFTEPARQLELLAANVELDTLRTSLAQLGSLARNVVIPD